MQNSDQIEEAVSFLKENIDEIYTVSEWADARGYSRGYFSELIRDEFDKTPYAILKNEKYKKVKQLVRENSDSKGRVIANDAGFADEKALYKFLSFHYQTSLSELRKEAN